MVKRVRRALGGQTQIERICTGPNALEITPHTPSMTHAFWNEWSTSKKLQSLYEDVGKSPDMDVNLVLTQIQEVKQISNSAV